MIERYSDHAANERTFLAWVRTAIAIMAFGFLVQKLALFLRIANQALDARSTSAGSQIVGNIAGLLLILLGGVVMPFAAIRFRKTTRDIDSKEVQPGPGERLDITFDLLGRLIVCEGDDRRLTRMGLDGKVESLVDNYKGGRFNRPNDVICHSNGCLYFTDPDKRRDRLLIIYSSYEVYFQDI